MRTLIRMWCWLYNRLVMWRLARLEFALQKTQDQLEAVRKRREVYRQGMSQMNLNLDRGAFARASDRYFTVYHDDTVLMHTETMLAEDASWLEVAIQRQRLIK